MSNRDDYPAVHPKVAEWRAKAFAAVAEGRKDRFLAARIRNARETVIAGMNTRLAAALVRRKVRK